MTPDSLVHADVQAGAAADVSGRSRTCRRCATPCSTRSSICGRATRRGLLRTDFTRKLGKISYHVPCHLRVQNLGLKTRDVLMLVPETQVEPIERCSGHNGTYGVKREFREMSMKIGRPVMRRVADAGADFYTSDCPMAGHQIESGLEPARRADASAEAAAHGVRDLTDSHLRRAQTDPRRSDEPRAVLGGAQGFPRARCSSTSAAASSRSGRTRPGASRIGSRSSTRCRRCCASSASSRPSGIQDELDAYNPLIPGRHELEGDVPDRVSRCRTSDACDWRALQGVEDRCWVQVAGFDRVCAIADEDLERENEEKTSSVHFLRFELSAGDVRARAKAGAAIAHRHRSRELPPRGRARCRRRSRDSLAKDLSVRRTSDQ